jgi:hypothetical protein
MDGPRHKVHSAEQAAKRKRDPQLAVVVDKGLLDSYLRNMSHLAPRP